MDIKVSEFSECVQLKDPEDFSMIKRGSKEIMAPEMAHNKGYSFEADLWALGILIFTLYFGYSPFINAMDLDDRQN
jgi:serine/threonine protein kinase